MRSHEAARLRHHVTKTQAESREPLLARERLITKNRLETLADGIFAIVMTLLVLGLMSPALSSVRTAEELDRVLVQLWPKVVSYVLSFVVVGIFWVAHHAEFHFIRRTNRRHMWINMLLLLCLSFLPFSADVLGEHYTLRSAVVLYGLNVMLAGLALELNWWYATSQRRLVDPNLDARVVRAFWRRLLVGPVCYGIALLVSLVSPTTAFFLYVAFAAMYVVIQLLPGPMDQAVHDHDAPNEAAASPTAPSVSGEPPS